MKHQFIAVLALGLVVTLTARAQVPGIINYQGRVSVGGTNFNGMGLFEFALVDGGNASVQATAFAASFDGFAGIASIGVINPGSGYTSVPNVTITDATGTGAVAIADIGGGMVTNIEVQADGANYNSPTITIDPPTASLVTNTYWSNDGSSVNGSQPTTNVSLTVTKGLYSVLLGDTTISNMTVAVPASAFSNNNVNLRAWFNDGVHGFQQLAPDQRLAAAGYALMAANVPDASITSAKIANSAITSSQISGGAVGAYQIASGAVDAFQIGSGQVVKSLNGLMDAVTLLAGSNITLTPSGNSIQIDATGGGGGGGTPSDTPNTVMSRDGSGNTAVSDLLAARLNVGTGNTLGDSQASIAGGQNNTASGTLSFVGGGYGNQATGPGSFVGGGGYGELGFGGYGVGPNYASGVASMVGGGVRNSASLYWSTVAGGIQNTANGDAATVAGGFNNQATNGEATVGGGDDNTAGGIVSTVAGGENNTANGSYSTVPGGRNNTAGGDASFAAGFNTTANDDDSFVWGDGTRQAQSQGANSFAALCTGGVWFYTGAGVAGVKCAAGASAWTTISDRNVKKNFQAVDTVAVLDKLATIPIQRWNYKWEGDNDVPNIGPMAQDFKAAFYPGRDDKGISTLEFDGVELAAIQGLNQKLEKKDAQIAELRQELAALKATVQKIGEQVEQSKAPPIQTANVRNSGGI